MKRKRVLLFWGCLVSVLLAGYVTLWLTRRDTPFKSEAIKSVKWGMTENEVNAVLGAQAEVFPFKRALYPLILKRGKDDEFISNCKEWIGEETSVLVYFDRGRVQWYIEGVILDNNQSLLDKLRRWLGIQ